MAGPHVHHGQYSSEYNSNVQCFHEIYSMWGNYEKLTYEILNMGKIIGVTGGGDNHEARGGFSCEDPEGQGKTPHVFAPGLKWKTGLTAALMPRLGRAELIRALRERQTYATTGPRILVDFSVSGVPMGASQYPAREQGASQYRASQQPASQYRARQQGTAEQAPAQQPARQQGSSPTVAATIHAAAKIARIEIIRDGQVAHTLPGDGPDLTIQWSDTAAPPGRHWYLLKVTQTDNEMAWTSPVWIETA